MELHRHLRENRFLLVGFVTLLLLSAGGMYLLQRTQDASPEELTNRLLLFVLWYLDISLIIILSFILVRNIVRLIVERRAGKLGSQFKTRLVLTYVGLTIIPVAFIFLIATNLLQRSIDRWFSSPVEEILRGGAAMTVELRQLVEDRLEGQAAMAAELVGTGSAAARLADLRQMMGVDLLAVYQGEDLLHAVADARRIPSSLPPLRWSDLPPAGVRAERWRAGLLVRAWSPGQGGSTIVVGDMLPRDLLAHLERATAMEAAFQEMKLARGTVTSTTVLVFLAVTLLLLFATVWIGLYLSRRFTEPLLAVAAATQRVAEGNQLEEVRIPASDEVAVLVHSFNAMVRRVRATEAEILASHQDLATLLATVPTGVLTVNADGRRFRPNPAAARLLGRPEWASSWHSLDELHDLEGLYQRLVRVPAREVSFELDLEREGSVRHLEVTMAPLPGGGGVVALDDLTQLVRAQRQAAWSAVAQRIAHEIRNPLTPIRLAAERIQRRAASLEPEMRDVVASGCQAIVAQVSGLKQLVDSFHEYARMPTVDPRPSPLARAVREACSLYEGIRPGVVVRMDLPPDDIVATFDPVLLRQALVNLLDNAVEAVGEEGSVSITATVDDDRLVLAVEDTGIGLPTDDTDLLLQPFYSTKGRGSGMGLALVHRIVADHGGTLELGARPDGGTRIRIVLPGAAVADGGG